MEPFNIDSVTLKEPDSGRRYYAFSVSFNVVGPFDPVTTMGWRYYPDTDGLSTPSITLRGGKFLNTHKISAARYIAIKDAIKARIGI